LIDYYTKTGKLLEVPGEGSMEEISERIIATLKPASEKINGYYDKSEREIAIMRQAGRL